MKKVSKEQQIKRQKIAQKRADYTKTRLQKQAALKLKAAPLHRPIALGSD